MSLNRYAARRDHNEDELLELAKRLGANITIAGPLDAWVSHRGKWTPVEIKAKKGKLTPWQSAFLKRCLANQSPVWVWRTTDDVLRDLGARQTA